MAKSDEQLERQDAKRNGKVARKNLPQGLKGASGVADWMNADPTLMLELVNVVANEHGAVRYGYTRDGGAYSIGIYLGGESKTYYCNEAEGINESIRELIEYFRNTA